MASPPAASARSASGTLRLGIVVALAVSTIIVFLPLATCDFINYDDKAYVSENVQVQNGLTWRGLVWALGTSWAANWHPLTWVSHMLDCQFYGLRAGGHHFTNVLLHTGSAILLFLVLSRMTRALWPSALVAALFALHPVHVESVAWVSERKDVLSTFFLMLTLWAYTRYTEQLKSEAPVVQGPKQQQGGKQPVASTPQASGNRRTWYVLSLLFFALGLMSKPMLVTVPFLLLLLDLWPLSRLSPTAPYPQLAITLKKLIWEKLPFFGLTVASSVITFVVQRSAGAMPSLERLPIRDRVGNAFISYWRYIGKALWPTKLAIFYPHPGTWPLWQVIVSVVLLCIVTGLVVRFWRARAYLFVGWFWFLGTLIPVLGLVQVGSQSMADRYTYIPLIGVFIMIAWGLSEAAHAGSLKARAIQVGSAAALVGCLVLTGVQVRYWKNSETLFSHALAVTRYNLTAELCLGCALTDNGNIEDGMAHLQEALRLDPKFADVHGKVGWILAGQGKTEEAITHYKEALKFKPDLPEALNNLAWTLATHPDPKIRDGAEAVRLAERACQLTQSQKTIFIGTLAAAYAEAGRFGDAMTTAQKARDRANTWNEKDLAKRNEELLELYRANKPYREAGPSNSSGS